LGSGGDHGEKTPVVSKRGLRERRHFFQSRMWLGSEKEKKRKTEAPLQTITERGVMCRTP